MVAGGPVGTRDLGRPHPAADPVPRLEHANVDAALAQHRRGGEPGQPGADDHHPARSVLVGAHGGNVRADAGAVTGTG